MAALLLLVLVLALAGLAAAPHRPVGGPFATRSEALGRRGAAATSHPLATEAAMAMLRRGGSAADAAIAANAVLAVVEPTGCGLGGDLFAQVAGIGDATPHGIDGSGRAPRGVSAEALRARGLARVPPRGPHAVTVPGCVDGWARLHDGWGRVPWAALFEEAIHHAEEGFAVTPVIAHHWARGAAVHRDAPGFADVHLPAGRPPAAGDVVRNPALAATLRLLAEDGPDAFYRGPLARRLDAFCRETGCALRAEDLATHEGRAVEPLGVAFRGADVHQLPPPGQGVAVLQMLALLEPLDLEGMGWGSVDLVHHLVEAKRIVFEDRARHVADPDHADVPVALLLDEDRLARQRAQIDGRRVRAASVPDDRRLGEGDTVNLAVGDAAGQMVSLIQSNYQGFGSGLCPPDLGFGLQNRGAGFALEAGHANVIAPGKRPFHTIIPGFATRGGRPWLAFGLMGGDMQPPGQVQVLVAHLVFGMDLQEAADAPRWYHSGSSEPDGTPGEGVGRLVLEAGFPAELADGLAARGHRLVAGPMRAGGWQAVARDEAGVYRASSESRKDGHAAAR